MARPLPAGSVAIQIIGQDGSFQQVIGQVNTKMQNFQKTVNNFGVMKMPGFQGFMANLRDASITFAAIGHLARRTWGIFKAATTEFSNFGNSIAKMSRATGIGANDLSLLGYAAEQSGSDMKTLGTSMRYFHRNLAAAGKGNKAAMETFGRLGIDTNKLKGLNTKDQFLVVADAIRRLGDETLQTDAAMKIFGRAGTSLLPMFQEGIGGITDLMREAQDLGIGMSDEDAAQAEKLNSAITRLQRSMQGLRTTIVSALAGPVTKIFDEGTRLMRLLREWINNNQSIARTLTFIAGASAVALPLVMGWRYVAPMFRGIAVAIGLVKMSLLKLVGLIVAPFVSLKALIVLAIAGAVGAFAYFTGAGTKLMSFLGGFGERIKSIFSSTFGDLVPLIQDGRILDAVKMLWLKIQLFFEEGRLAIMNRWNEVAAAISEPFLAIYDAVYSAVKPAIEWLTDTFFGLGDWIADQFAVPMQWLCDMFGTWWNYIKGGWDALMNDLGYVIVGTWWSIASGINTVWAWLRTQWNNLLTGIQIGILSAMKVVVKVVDSAFGTLFSLVSAFAGALGFTITNPIKTAIDGIDKMIDGVRQRAGVKANEITDTKQARQAALDDMAMNSLNNVNTARANAPQTSDRAEQLRREIAELRKPILEPEKREKVREVTKTAQQIAEKAETTGVSSIIAGTMNKQDILGGALAYMASEKDHSEDIADNTEKTVALLKELNDKAARNDGMTYI